MQNRNAATSGANQQYQQDQENRNKQRASNQTPKGSGKGVKK